LIEKSFFPKNDNFVSAMPDHINHIITKLLYCKIKQLKLLVGGNEMTELFHSMPK